MEQKTPVTFSGCTVFFAMQGKGRVVPLAPFGGLPRPYGPWANKEIVTILAYSFSVLLDLLLTHLHVA